MSAMDSALEKVIIKTKKTRLPEVFVTLLAHMGLVFALEYLLPE